VSVSPRPPRDRYIAFRLEAPADVSRDAFLAALRARVPSASLLSLRGGMGLVRCTNLDKDATIAALVALDRVGSETVRVTTLGTSGTIRKATQKYLR